MCRIRIRFDFPVLTVLSLCLIVPVLAGPGRFQRVSEAPALRVVQTKAGYELAMRGEQPFYATARVIEDERLIAVSNSNVLLALWDEKTASGGLTHHYAISLDGLRFRVVRETSYDLLLRYKQFDPLTDGPGVEPSFSAGADTRLFIVQFVTQPLEEFRAAIRKLGGTVYHYLANHAHIVRMSPDVRQGVAALPYVRWVGPFHPAYRLEEFMLGSADRGAELFGLQKYNIMVFESGTVQKTAVAQRIEAMGGIVDRRDAGKVLLEATLTPEQLFEVIRWDEVLFVDRWGPYEADMDIARESGGANHIETVAGYTGQGVRGEVYDTGFNLDHCDFASRPLIVHGSAGSASHGASTSGIVFGDGTCNPAARGLLPSGHGIVSNYNGTLGQPSRYTHTGELLQFPYFGVFQTSSVGSPRTSQYTTISADTDAALFDFDIVHVQAFSHSGQQLARPQGWAKNIISVGASYHYNTLTKDDDCWCGSGSTGPATDGRIKPDFTHFYDSILTVSNSGPTSYTSTFGGSSASTPIVAGYVGLFFQMWSDGIFGNPVNPGATVFENRSHMTTAKAMLINTTFQYDWINGPTANRDLSRYRQGWGMPDVKNMYELRTKFLIIDESVVLNMFELARHLVIVLPNEPALRVTMTYADPPGVPNSNRHRINDLTLRVISPSQAIYWGNNGLLAGRWSTPGGSPNTIDTVENVFIENPEAGTWIVEVHADEINQDGHVETPDVDADFALVVSGVVSGGCPGDLDGDGDTDLDDLPHFVDALLGNPPAHAGIDQTCADMDGDGDHDGNDARHFVNVLAGP